MEFWKQAPAIAASPHGPRAFPAALGRTFEQANLDFALLYRDAFREAGDDASARVCQIVHDDELGHVRLAAEGEEFIAQLRAASSTQETRPRRQRKGP